MPTSTKRRRSGATATKRRPLWLASREYRELLVAITNINIQVQALSKWVNDFTEANEKAKKRAEDASKIVVPV